MAKPKKREELDDPIELEWDVADEPQAEAFPDSLIPGKAESPEKIEKLEEIGAPVPARPRAARRKPRQLPVVFYAVVFVVVALATAALVILFT